MITKEKMIDNINQEIKLLETIMDDLKSQIPFIEDVDDETENVIFRNTISIMDKNFILAIKQSDDNMYALFSEKRMLHSINISSKIEPTVYDGIRIN